MRLRRLRLIGDKVEGNMFRLAYAIVYAEAYDTWIGLIWNIVVLVAHPCV